MHGLLSVSIPVCLRVHACILASCVRAASRRCAISTLPSHESTRPSRSLVCTCTDDPLRDTLSYSTPSPSIPPSASILLNPQPTSPLKIPRLYHYPRSSVCRPLRPRSPSASAAASWSLIWLLLRRDARRAKGVESISAGPRVALRVGVCLAASPQVRTMKGQSFVRN